VFDPGIYLQEKEPVQSDPARFDPAEADSEA